MSSLIPISETIISNNTGLDAITRAPIVDYETKVRCLRIQNVSHDEPFEMWGYTEVSEQNYKNFQLQKDDIIISRTGGSIGTLMYIDKDYKSVYNNGLICLKIDKERYNPRYIYYCLKLDGFKKHIQKCSLGNSTQENIRMNDMLEYMIPDFKLTIQNQIVEVLKDLDDKIQNNNAINAELESMAKTIYDYWFLQFEFPNEEGKPYKSSGGKMVWNEELKREIPEGWNTTTIGDITICHDSERIPLSGKDRESMIGDIPYYGATDIMGYVNRPIFDGDYVLLAEDGSVMDEDGHPILQRVTGQVWVNNHAHVLEPIKNHSCKLLMMFLKDVYVPMIKTGSIQMKINQENMNGITVPNIPEDIKDKINLELCTIERKQLQIIAENRELASLRDFLLPMLMNGQVGFK